MPNRPNPREGLTVGYCPAPPGPRSWWGFYFRRLKPTAIHGVALRATRRNQEWPNSRVMPFGRRTPYRFAISPRFASFILESCQLKFSVNK